MPTYFCRSCRSLKVNRSISRSTSRKLKVVLKKTLSLVGVSKAKSSKRSQLQASRLLNFSKKGNNFKFAFGATTSVKRLGVLRRGATRSLSYKNLRFKIYRNFEVYNCLKLRSRVLKRIPETSRLYSSTKFKGCKFQYLAASINYRVWRFKSSTKRLLILGNLGCGILQDKDYIILYKSDLTKFGLIVKEENSIEEIFSALLPFWSGETPSAQVNISFYRYFVLEGEDSCYQIQSFLITLKPKASTSTFPSPSSFI